MKNLMEDMRDSENQQVKTKFSWEEVGNILYKQALKIHSKSNGRYEINELINEVWAKQDIQKLSNIEYVSARAYFDMIDYVRKIDGTRDIMKKGKRISRPKFRTNIHRHQTKTFSSDMESNDFFDAQEGREKDPFDDMVNKDEVKNILSHLSDKSRKLIELYFLKELSLKETGKMLGLNPTTTSTNKKQILRDIFDRHHEKEQHKMHLHKKVKKKVDRTLVENILPEYVVDFEIGNECATGEELVFLNDWQS